LAAQFVSKGHFISKFSALAEFIEYLPTAADFGVICFLREPVAEKKFSCERAEAECCETSFI